MSFNRFRATILCGFGITILSIIFVLSSTSVHSDMSSDKRFQYAMKVILKHEGGLGNSKYDSGSWTNYGISLRYIKSIHLDINHDGKEDKNDIIQLTLTEADSIYYKNWFLKYHYDKIKNEDILTDIFDFSVNAGGSECHKLIKRAINDITNDGIEVNGTLDQKTIDMINLIEPVVFHSALQQEQEDFYRGIVKRNPHLRIFLSGWLKRIGD